MDWQAFGAVSSALIASILVIVTIYYANQTKKQARVMYEQLRLDRLAKHRDRLDKEMTKIVGPIHSRRNENLLFGPYMFSPSQF